MRTSIAEGKRHIILCAPTGSGKTVMFTFMVASALQRGKRCIIFTDRVELLKQSNGALDQFGIVPTLIEAGKPRLDVSGNCFIAMAQTYARRKNKADYADLMAGMGAFSTVQAARIAKTRLYFEDRAAFMAQLVSEVRAFIRKAIKLGLIPVVRLNGTSDIPWERVPVEGKANIMDLFPSVQFYDYTKRHNRRNLPTNYHLKN